ncbi:ATPase [Anaerovibrio lipolyticus]|uniref:ATPase n=1 Tax=Anaerovibrio lipolyticus TaxID=82374 RepID=A0A0B2JXN7_9FIRM|nr:AAA family ATPase [Anaerovibrio lipolyticus]KHM51411.1 ATPase [Anaerovibrio lipolyticus]
MIEQLKIKNFGMHHKIDCNKLGKINLIIGENGTGKTFLMKAMYTAIKTIEQYKKGQDNKSMSDILADKLYWTFQPDSLGELVNKNGKGKLRFSMQAEGKKFEYSFGSDTVRKIIKLESEFQENRADNSVFIPAKEVLSLYQIILKSRDQDRAFGFDDTYVDLARALMLPGQQGNNYRGFAESRDRLRGMVNGRVDLDSKNNRWYYYQDRNKYTIGETAEGIKKVAIFDRLLVNRYISRNSIIFLDELESSLHPSAVVEFLDIIYHLAKSGVQFFIASHSYFIIKKLYLLAKKYHESIPVLSLSLADEPMYEDLKNGMPDNSIIDAAIALYNAEVDMLTGDDDNGNS